jgi:ribonuclease R
LCLLAELDKSGRVRSFDLVEGIMRSAAMLTYGGVARALGFTEETPRSSQADALKRDLKVIDELARKLRRARLKRGSLDLDIPEARVLIDEQTKAPIDVHRRTADPGIRRAYQMVEELMLLANECVAKWLSRRRSPTVYRVHGKPDEEKLEQFAAVAKILGAPCDLERMLEPVGMADWLRSIQEHPRREVLEMLLLRSMKQASYDIVNIGHFGLASDAYVHFTSPIRRYPDIQVHRAIKHLLAGRAPDTTEDAIEALRASATAASVRERATADVEREVVDLYRTLLMRDQVGEVFEARVVAIVGGGLFATLDHPFVDVLVRYDALGSDHYEAAEDELSVVGRRSGDTIRLGDPLLVEIEDVAVLRRTVYARRIPPDDVRAELEQQPGRRGRGRSNTSKRQTSKSGRGRERGRGRRH